MVFEAPDKYKLAKGLILNSTDNGFYGRWLLALTRFLTGVFQKPGLEAYP
jgi:hypothetical protein